MDNQEPHRIDDILIELLKQYEARFPGIHITVMEEPQPC